mmetsp:Transcript_58156/g.151145  ORF Transcript_58156/g.151145 Transcript_58156/m.151145 type:complete len:205 (-) Transcript_58156:2-616(-)
MRIEDQEPLLNLLDRLIHCNLQHVLLLRHQVHDLYSPGARSRAAYQIPRVSPPRRAAIGRPVGLGALGGNVDVPAPRAVDLLEPRLGVDVRLGLAGLGVEPVGDVRASGIDDGLRQGARVLQEEGREVVDLAEVGDPAVVGGAVLGDVRCRVVPLERVGLRDVTLVNGLGKHWQARLRHHRGPAPRVLHGVSGGCSGQCGARAA